MNKSFQDVLQFARRKWPNSGLTIQIICGEKLKYKVVLTAVLNHWSHRIEKQSMEEVYDAIFDAPKEIAT